MIDNKCYKLGITKKIYKKLQTVIKYGHDFYSTNKGDHLLLLESNTMKLIELKNSKLLEIVGNHRRINLTLEVNKISKFKHSYILIILFK